MLEWVDVDKKDCFIETKDSHGKTKGLFQLCKELNLIPNNSQSKQFSLPELIELAKGHPAFETKTILSQLASKYGVKVIYLPKFH